MLSFSWSTGNSSRSHYTNKTNMKKVTQYFLCLLGQRYDIIIIYITCTALIMCSYKTFEKSHVMGAGGVDVSRQVKPICPCSKVIHSMDHVIKCLSDQMGKYLALGHSYRPCGMTLSQIFSCPDLLLSLTTVHITWVTYLLKLKILKKEIIIVSDTWIQNSVYRSIVT